MAWSRLICFIGIISGIWLVLRNENSGYLIASACTVFFLIALKYYNEAQTKSKLLGIRIKLHSLELEALDGNYDGFDDGKRFMEPSHPYSFDLDVFGPKSLYNQVCRTTTPSGDKHLSELLVTPVSSITDLENRQKLVQAFAANPKFCIDFRVAGGGIGLLETTDFEQQLKYWTHVEYPFLMSRWIRIAVMVSSLSMGVLLLLKLVWAIPFSWFTAPLIFNFLLLGIHIRKINNINAQSGIISEATAILHKLLLTVQKHQFNFEKLNILAHESESASRAIRKLNALLNVFDIRLNMILGALLNLLFLFDFHCLFRIEDWKRKHKDLINKSYDTLTFIDVYQSLGNWAFLNPTNTYPVFIEGNAEIYAEKLKHPLINPQDAIGNTLSLGKNEKLVVLTGANMTGKSTWLRTIGLSVIAANCGLPISSSSATLPLLNVYTSMRITDSLDTGISYFKAELNRLKSMLDTVVKSYQTWLILLDEPLRGTNSGDKQAGTIGLINRFLKLPVIGLVATHDAALCELKESQLGKLSNYHFDSQLVGTELKFDYHLKEGCSTSNNATLLMQLTGILEKAL
jgi:DNA mismatch repair ATPase MutS